MIMSTPGEQRFNLVVQRALAGLGTSRSGNLPRTVDRSVVAALRRHGADRIQSRAGARRSAVGAADRTLMPGTNLPVGYVNSNPDGDDGRPISDYDVIGSATRRSGLFALEDVDELAFLYMPPLTRTTDIGVSTVLVAAKFCRQRRAMLIVDPPAAWDSAAEAVRGLKRLNFHSDHALMFFPRLVTTDRLRGRAEMFGNGGAVAGILSRTGEAVSAAIAARDPEPLLRAGAPGSRSGAGRSLVTRSAWSQRAPRRPQRGSRAATAANAGMRCERLGGLVVPVAAPFRVVRDQLDRARHALVRARPGDPLVWGRVTAQVRRFLAELHAQAHLPRCLPTRRST